MNRKKVLMALAGICLLAAIVMYMVGKDSSHLSELKDFFWMPLPLAAILFLIAVSGRKTT